MPKATTYTETEVVQVKTVRVNLSLTVDEAQAITGLLGAMSEGDPLVTTTLDEVYNALHDALVRIDEYPFWGNPRRRENFDAPPLYC